MRELNSSIGEELQEELCEPCRKKLKAKLKRWHLFAPARLHRIIFSNTCDKCQAAIMEARKK